jgi:small GTP-binding protein
MIGDSTVGKTSIVNRLIDDTFVDERPQTVTANWHVWTATISGVRTELQIWDTAGQERYRALGPIYYRGSRAAILVYDVTDAGSFRSLKSWTTSYFESVSSSLIFIVGNKTDLIERRQVSTDEGRKWAELEKLPFFETSAKEGEGVRELFVAVYEAVSAVAPARLVPREPMQKETKEECGC